MIIKTHGPDRAYKLCECAECGVTQMCTPRSDFYTRGPKEPYDGQPIVCEACMWSPKCN